MHYDELIFYFKFLVFEQLLYTSYYSIYIEEYTYIL